MSSKRKQKNSNAPDKPHDWNLVVVNWLDAAFSDNTDFAANEVLEPIELTTCGFIIKETKKFLTLAAEYSVEDGSTRHQFVIPKSGIKNIERF
jgi:hypothetical protein